MQLIKLDKKRSYDASRTYEKDELTYYKINDTDEACVLVNEPDDIGKIEERICVPPIEDDGSFAKLLKDHSIPEGEYRVTTMLINKRKVVFNMADEIPDFIQRVYFSKESLSEYTSSSILLANSEHPFLCDGIWGLYSKDKTELFHYCQKNVSEINFPDCIQTIHSYAFVNAEIGTLRIPATVTEIGKGAFLNAKIGNVIFEGKWTEDIDPEAFSNLKVLGSIRINDTAQNVSSYNELLNAVGSDCRKLILAAPDICKEESSSIGYIRVTQAYYSNNYYRWNNIQHNEGIIDINTRYIVSVKEYEIPTYLPVKGSVIALSGVDNDRQQYYIIVYEPKETVMKKIDTAVKQINASGCTIDELIDRIKNNIK